MIVIYVLYILQHVQVRSVKEWGYMIIGRTFWYTIFTYGQTYKWWILSCDRLLHLFLLPYWHLYHLLRSLSNQVACLNQSAWNLMSFVHKMTFPMQSLVYEIKIDRYCNIIDIKSPVCRGLRNVAQNNSW